MKRLWIDRYGQDVRVNVDISHEPEVEITVREAIDPLHDRFTISPVTPVQARQIAAALVEGADYCDSLGGR